MKQTSIEWLVEQLPIRVKNYLPEEIAKALQMHKEEIEDAYGHGQNNGYMYAHKKAITITKENYYNKTYERKTT